MAAAVMRRKAVPMPMGRILDRLCGSLWSAMTYCAAKDSWMVVGVVFVIK
jgi:hypothetical protein